MPPNTRFSHIFVTTSRSERYHTIALFRTRPPTTSTTKDAFSHCETCPAAARKTPNGVSVRHVSKLERCLTASGNLTWDVSKGQKRLFRALFRAKIQHNFSTKYPYSTKWSYGCLPCHKEGCSGGAIIVSEEYSTWVSALRMMTRRFGIRKDCSLHYNMNAMLLKQIKKDGIYAWRRRIKDLSSKEQSLICLSLLDRYFISPLSILWCFFRLLHRSQSLL